MVPKVDVNVKPIKKLALSPEKINHHTPISFNYVAKTDMEHALSSGWHHDLERCKCEESFGKERQEIDCNMYNLFNGTKIRLKMGERAENSTLEKKMLVW